MISKLQVAHIYITKTEWSRIRAERKSYQNKTNRAPEWAPVRQKRGDWKVFLDNDTPIPPLKLILRGGQMV